MLKPTLEILAGIPSVVLGFFAISVISPEVVQRFFGATDPVQPDGGGHRRRDPVDPAGGVGVGGRPAQRAPGAARGELRHGGPQDHHHDPGRPPGRGVRAWWPPSSWPPPAPSARRWWCSSPAAPAAARCSTSTRLEPGLTMTAAMASQATGTDAVVGEALTFQSLFFVGSRAVPHHVRAQRHRLPLRAAGADQLLGDRWPSPPPPPSGPGPPSAPSRDQLTRGGTDWAGSVFLVLLFAVARLQHPRADHPDPRRAPDRHAGAHRALRGLHDRHPAHAGRRGRPVPGPRRVLLDLRLRGGAGLPARDRGRALPRGVRRRHRASAGSST